MNLALILDYLKELENNNNREWYHSHKAEQIAANREFEVFLEELILELRKTDQYIPLTSPRELTFKLARDTRFSKDKSPYNPVFRAHIAPNGKLPIPVGYFILLRPGDRSFLGGGLFTDMFKDATSMVRDYIVTHGDEWESIITSPGFTEHFTVGGTTLKNVPKGYDPDHPQSGYLKNKSWYLEFPVPDKQILCADFVDYAAGIFMKMQAFNGFLNRALDRFRMPAR